MLSHRLILLGLLFGLPDADWKNLATGNNENAAAAATDDSSPLLTEESLLDTMKQAQDFLDQYEIISIDTLPDEIGQVEESIRQLQAQKEQVDDLVKDIINKNRQAVGQQISHFKDRLVATHNKVAELMESNTTNSRLSDTDGDDAASVETKEDDEEIVPEYVPIRDLKKKFETRRVMDKSEKELVAWIQELIEDELTTYKNKIFKISEVEEEQVEVADKEGEEEEEACPSLNEVVQQVQAAVIDYSQDGIGMIDHIQGGEIVHSMTSPTYEPPADFSELLGNVWWRKYIPEDWEGLLPDGWKEWNTRIPSIFYHSLNIRGAKVSPPEAVMQKKTIPGSCWPMEGSRGQFTIRLPYPIFVDLFSVDHVSPLIVPQEVRDTAPKKLKVIGYPPCDSEDCMALGFDVHDPMDIGIINYNSEGPSIQTFESVFAQAVNVDDKLKEQEELEDEEGMMGYDDGGGLGDEVNNGGCSAGATACSSPPVVAFAGLTVKVLENWGNPDYTCIYRFRLHGNPDYNI